MSKLWNNIDIGKNYFITHYTMRQVMRCWVGYGVRVSACVGPGVQMGLVGAVWPVAVSVGEVVGWWWWQRRWRWRVVSGWRWVGG